MAVIRGISFPFRKGPKSFPAEALDDVAIKDSLIQLILVGPGERVMRPAYGANARAFIFEPNSQVLSSLIQTEISTVVAIFEPRVTLRGVAVRRIESEVIVTIQYLVNLTRQSATMSVSLGQSNL